jgi:SNF2 family DNA or RNA helicase
MFTSAATPPLFAHQEATLAKLRGKPSFYDMSEPGTAKTRVALQEFWERRQQGDGPALVLAPKSILKSAWGNDANRWIPGATHSIAYASNREKAFKVKADIYITNWDALTWLAKNQNYIRGFSTLIGDESTAVKNPQTDRTKALFSIAPLFPYRRLMSGTVFSNCITELWAQMLALDAGERLGTSFYRFRSAVCEPKQIGPQPNHLEWNTKPGAEAAVFDLIGDISIRHELEKCQDMPGQIVRLMEVDLPAKVQKYYDEMEAHGLLELADGDIMAPAAAAVRSKLLQISAGAVYDGDKVARINDDGRAELVMDLIEERKICLVAFNWKHQRDQLVTAATKRGFKFAVIDGETPGADRAKIVSAYQAGSLRVVFAHPQSAGHGLTMTKGTTTIWASPTDSAELWEQFNRRQYRAGQTERCEVLKICANDTVEEVVYANCESKLVEMNRFRSLVDAA